MSQGPQPETINASSKITRFLVVSARVSVMMHFSMNAHKHNRISTNNNEDANNNATAPTNVIGLPMYGPTIGNTFELNQTRQTTLNDKKSLKRKPPKTYRV